MRALLRAALAALGVVALGTAAVLVATMAQGLAAAPAVRGGELFGAAFALVLYPAAAFVWCAPLAGAGLGLAAQAALQRAG